MSLSPVAAQDDDRRPPDPIDLSGPPEIVIVYGPHHEERREAGAPLANMSLSHTVRFDDLDLRTDWGADELRRRILDTADALCSQIGDVYSGGSYLTAWDNPPCRKRAIDDAMAQADAIIAQAQADAAIAQARGGNE